MNIARCFLLVFLAAGAALPSVQSGGMQTFQASADVTLCESGPSTNYGGTSTNSADGDDPPGSGMELVTLMKWDLTPIPPGSVVLSVQINLHVTNVSAGEYKFYRVVRDWREAEATWNEAESGVPWNGAGASGAQDRGFTERGGVPAGVAGPVTIPLGAEGITAVQAWVDGPTVNHGFVLADGLNSDGLAFASREASVAGQRPTLTVSWMANTSSGAVPDGGSGFCGATGMEAVAVFALMSLLRLYRRRSGERGGSLGASRRSGGGCLGGSRYSR